MSCPIEDKQWQQMTLTVFTTSRKQFFTYSRMCYILILDPILIIFEFKPKMMLFLMCLTHLYVFLLFCKGRCIFLFTDFCYPSFFQQKAYKLSKISQLNTQSSEYSFKMPIIHRECSKSIRRLIQQKNFYNVLTQQANTNRYDYYNNNLSLSQMLSSQQQTWPFIASIIYTAAWSISFYGQVYENYIYKSVEGYSMNYLVMNINGYLFYSIYSTLGYFFHMKGAGTVVIADLFFVYHALLMCLILSIQALIYPHGKNRISFFSIVFCISLWAFITVQVVFTVFLNLIPEYELFNPVSCLGYCKLAISFLKYSPAVYWNWKRKSTKGWSIFNIILDLVGATFSIASGGLSISNGLNITKMILAVMTVGYDLIFVFQHYCLYNKRNKKQDNFESLQEQHNLNS